MCISFYYISFQKEWVESEKEKRLIEVNLNSRYLKILTCEGRDFAAGVYLSEAPPPPSWVFVRRGLAILWPSNLVRYIV